MGDGHFARAWATKGLSLQRSGFAQAALEWLDRALAVDPQNRGWAEARAASLAALKRVARG
jgi:tetratricopeptide (TPR) repeat protein